MITFIVSILILLVVAPSALVMGLKLAGKLIKHLFKRGYAAFEDWLNKNGL